MAQTTDYEIANSSGLVFRGRVNEVLAAVQSNNSGATTPTGTVAYQLWYDTTTNTLKMRNAANSDWIILLDNSGGAVVATQAEAETGTNNTKVITPLGVRNALRATGSAPVFSARAFGIVSSAGALQTGSANVTSSTKISTGVYQVTMTTAMPSVNYSPQATPIGASAQSARRFVGTRVISTTVFEVNFETSALNAGDAAFNFVVFGNV
jgi:hypothetical protein